MILGIETPLVNVGDELVTTCPLEDCRGHMSFKVNEQRNTWRCLKCLQGGDVIRFMQLMEGLNLTQATKRLAEYAGMLATQDATASDPALERPVDDQRAGTEVEQRLVEPTGFPAKQQDTKRTPTWERPNTDHIAWAEGEQTSDLLQFLRDAGRVDRRWAVIYELVRRHQ